MPSQKHLEPSMATRGKRATIQACNVRPRADQPRRLTQAEGDKRESLDWKTEFLNRKKVTNKAEPVHDRLRAGFPDGLTALRSIKRDSPPDLFRRPRHTGPESRYPSAASPFTPAISVAFPGATDVSRASIMPCSIAPIIIGFMALSRLNKISA